MSSLWYIFGWVLDLSIFQASRVALWDSIPVLFSPTVTILSLDPKASET